MPLEVIVTSNISVSNPSPQRHSYCLINISVPLGLAVLATLSATRSETLVAGGHSTAAALTGGYHLAFLIGALLVAAAVVIGLTVIAPDAKAVGHASEHAPAGAQAACEPA